MNLQDKNLVKQKLMNQTRLLKSLGVYGLLISDKKMLELHNIVDHSNDKNNNASNVKVLFIGSNLNNKSSEEGKLFGNIITKGMNLKHENVSIIDTDPFFKESSPITNREELVSLIQKEVDFILPLVIVSLGEKNSQLILNTDKPLDELRNKFYNFNGFNLLCTLDLDLLIKDSSKKKLIWEDIKKVNRGIDDEK